MAGAIRAKRLKQVPLSGAENDLPRLLREAEKGEIVITRDGKPAGVLISFASDEDWSDYRLENDPRFLTRIERARASLRAGSGVKLEDVDEPLEGLSGAKPINGTAAIPCHRRKTNPLGRAWAGRPRLCLPLPEDSGGRAKPGQGDWCATMYVFCS